jgi:hypothetical protein
MTSTPTVIGQRIHGMLAYPGISRNNRMYTLAALANAPEALPLILNHATIEGTDGITEDFLPEGYRQRLKNGEEIQVGTINPKFDFDTYRLNYTAEVTDPHFSQKHILENMNVSLGLRFPKGEKECDALACYDMVKESSWKEVSLVFRPGFDIATLSTESKSNGSLSLQINKSNQMVEENIAGNGDSNKANETVGDGTGQPSAPAQGQCPQGFAPNATTGECEEIETSQNSTPGTLGAPPVVDKSTEQQDPDDEDEDKKAAMLKKKQAEEAYNHYRKQIDMLYPSTEGLHQTHKDNADLKTENARNTNYHDGLEKAEHLESIGLLKKANEVREQVIKSLGLEKELREAKEAVKPQAKIPTPKTTQVAGVTIANEASLPNNAYTWFKQVQAEELNVPKSKEYRINKQYIYENHAKRYYKSWNADAMGLEKVQYAPIPINARAEATEVLTNPSSDGDYINTMSEQVIVDPEGKFTTPIRQFSDVQVLSPGQKTGLFYDINKPDFGVVDEGGTGVPETAVSIRSAGGKPTPRGGLVTLKYSEVEEIPFDVIAKLNQGFAVESLVDETRLAVNVAFNTDTAHSPATDRKPIGGGAKTGRWVNGNDGSLNPTDTGAALGLLDYAGLLAGKGVIEDSGFYDQIQMYTNGKSIRDVTKSASIDSYIQFSRPLIITEGTVERIAGVNLIRSSELPTDGTGDNNLRGCMFATGAFGIVTGRDLTMEAQRRNEFQTILLTGTQKVLAVVRHLEKTCRVSFTK